MMDDIQRTPDKRYRIRDNPTDNVMIKADV